MDKRQFHPFTFNESSPFLQLGRPGKYTAWIRGLGDSGPFSRWSGSAWCIASQPEEEFDGVGGLKFGIAKLIYLPPKVSRTTADGSGQRGYVMAGQGVFECLYHGSAVEIFCPAKNVARQLMGQWKASANVAQWNELHRAIKQHDFRVYAEYEETAANPEMYETLDRMIREEVETLCAASNQQ